MQKLILLFCLFILPVFVSAQIVNIPDSIFKAYLVGNTAINTNGDGEIQVTEASAFTGTIGVSSPGISDLTGIEAFTALTVLWCYKNSLTSLDVSNNTALTDLGCSSNLLTSLDVSQNTALTTLNCWGNSLTGLDVTNNTALTILGCDNNSLTSLDVSNNTALTVLSCQYNSLTSLDVTQNTALTELYCSTNPLATLDVSQNTALTDLYCWGNYLTALDIRNGNNVNITGFNAKKNANLYCISVDNTAYSNANWSLDKDSWAVYSNNCTVGIEDHQLSQPIITTANTITIAGTGTAGIYNLLGKEVAKASLPATIRIKESGVYLVRVETEGRVVTRKVLLSNR